jgi:hypothetical protein
MLILALRILAAAAAFVLCLSVAPEAFGGPLDKPRTRRAKAHYVEGVNRFRLGQWEAAIQSWENGSLIEGELPIWHFLLAQAHRLAGESLAPLSSDSAKAREHLEKARWHYSRFLVAASGREHPDDPEVGDYAANAEKHLATVDALLVQVRERQSPPESRSPAPATPPEPLVQSSPVRQPAPTVEDDLQSPRWYHDKLGWSLLGAGVAIEIAAGASYLKALAVDNEADEEFNTVERDRLRDQERSWRGGATYLAIGGAAVVGTAIVKLALHPAHDRRVALHSGVPSVTVGATEQSMSVVFSGSF